LDTNPLSLPQAPSPACAAMRPSFLEYLMGGCEIELTIAIDFTGSNGDPRIPGTLHFIRHDGGLNDYEKAIMAVGGVIARYDSDQKFPVLGFGAKDGGVLNHCFQVGNVAELNGLNNVLQAYRQALKCITMSRPTVFSEVIDHTANVARESQREAAGRGKQSYRVLLILTDGVVSDLDQTKISLLNASDAPLSVVIVGIGNSNFDKMQELDDFANGDRGYRDICQFVPFSKYRDSKSALATATLEEIPDQLVDYYFGKGIKPMPAVNNNDTILNHCCSMHDEEPVTLNIDFTPDGEPNLIDHQGCFHNDNEYNPIQTILSTSGTQK
jgi:Copine